MISSGVTISGNIVTGPTITATTSVYLGTSANIISGGAGPKGDKGDQGESGPAADMGTNRVVSDNTIFLEDDRTIVVTGNNSDTYVTLPDAITTTYPVTVKKINADYPVMVQAPLGQLIDGEAQQILISTNAPSLSFSASNGNWYLI